MSLNLIEVDQRQSSKSPEMSAPVKLSSTAPTPYIAYFSGKKWGMLSFYDMSHVSIPWLCCDCLFTWLWACEEPRFLKNFK